MRKLKASILVLAAFAVLVGGTAQAAGAYEDTFMDKVGDWIATVGKAPEDRDQILLERRTKRTAERMKRDMKEFGDKADKKMKELGKEMKSLLE